jgi:hypothetical protein
MLLYVDHQLGEDARAVELADSLVKGKVSGENPYALAMAAMTMRDDPRADPSQVNMAFNMRMEYGLAWSTYSDAIKYAYMMKVGFANARGSYLGRDVVMPMPMTADPFFRALDTSREGTAPVNAGVPTASTRK